MALGGKREGAGRKPGSRNKRTEEQVKAVEASGVTPLEFMLAALRDESKDFATRMDAAFKAAPYVHPKLSSVDAKIDAEVSATVQEIRRTYVNPEPRPASDSREGI